VWRAVAAANRFAHRVGDQLAVVLVEQPHHVFERTADALGETATSELLEDLERVLLDVANGSPDPTAGEIESWRQRIDQQDLVFRLRVVGAELRRRQSPASPTY